MPTKITTIAEVVTKFRTIQSCGRFAALATPSFFTCRKFGLKLLNSPFLSVWRHRLGELSVCVSLGSTFSTQSLTDASRFVGLLATTNVSVIVANVQKPGAEDYVPVIETNAPRNLCSGGDGFDADDDEQLLLLS